MRKRKKKTDHEAPRSGRFTRDELEAMSGDVLPERAAMSVLANIAKVDAGLAVAATPDDLVNVDDADTASTEEEV